MRYATAGVLLASVVLAGCSHVMDPRYDPFRGPYDANVERLKDAVFSGESPLGITISDSRNRRYQPGLSITAKAFVRAGTEFSVWAVVADENWKPIGDEWDRYTVRWSMVRRDDQTSHRPADEKRDGAAMVAVYRLDQPGAYRLRCREVPQGARRRLPVMREASVDIRVN